MSPIAQRIAIWGITRGIRWFLKKMGRKKALQAVNQIFFDEAYPGVEYNVEGIVVEDELGDLDEFGEGQ